MIDSNLIKMLIAGILFGSLFLVNKKWQSTIGWILIGYLILIAGRLI